MDILTNKTILIISPQAWGTMFVAKHHYAVELAKHGNQVYFLNPPDNNKWSIAGKHVRIKVEPFSGNKNLFLVWHDLYFPFVLKFHAKKIFDFLMRKQVKDIVSVINKSFDIVWSFDLGNLYPFSNFRNSYKIFHPVDEPQNENGIRSAADADILFSVTKEIIEKYHHLNIPKYFINHGVSDHFFSNSFEHDEGSIRVGISGNLFRPEIDRETMLKIITENPEVVFEIWGSYEINKANLSGGTDNDSEKFITGLKTFSNVILHGAVSSEQLSRELGRMDAFLICYDVQKDQSKGTNYHKIMEYLSSGKVIISNNVTTYSKMPHLVQMVPDRTHNNALPGLFKYIIQHLVQYNSPDLVKERITYARNNGYNKQLDRIDSIISQNGRMINQASNSRMINQASNK
jgi:hypothetical protein